MQASRTQHETPFRSSDIAWRGTTCTVPPVSTRQTSSVGPTTESGPEPVFNLVNRLEAGPAWGMNPRATASRACHDRLPASDRVRLRRLLDDGSREITRTSEREDQFGHGKSSTVDRALFLRTSGYVSANVQTVASWRAWW